MPGYTATVLSTSRAICAQTYERLCERHIEERDLRTVMSFAERILECPMEVIEGVEETLAYLAARHDLTLFTKGHPEEQKLKVDRSGLGRYFNHTAIVKEKDAPAYRELVEERAMDPARDLDDRQQPEIGREPGARGGVERGLHSPCAYLGAGERGDPAGGGRLLVFERFEQLRERF